MSDIVSFTSPTNGSVRTVVINGEPWFVLADLCRALNIGNTSDVKKRLDIHGVDAIEVIDGMGRPQTTMIVNEPNMYEVVIRSDKPEAVEFRRWITGDVLPQIRKTGVFFDPSKITRKEMALMIFEAEERLEIEQAARRNAEEHAQSLQPSANAWDALADARGDYGVADAAKVLSRDPGILTGERRLFGFMAAQGWINRRGGRWRAYQAQVDNGRIVEKVNNPFEMNGEMVTPAPTVRVTPKGLRELHRLLGGAGELAAIAAT
jgi:prophage antirepressor-like protein